MSTLTLTQLQRTYGAALYELKSEAQRQTEAANPAAAASNSQEIIPDENNPLFMSVEQRAEAFARQQRIARNEPEPASSDAPVDRRLWCNPETAKFIDEMKVKYAAVKDAANVGTLYMPFALDRTKTSITPEMQKEQMGNAFVVKVGEVFSNVIDKLSSIQSNQEAIDRNLKRLETEPNVMEKSATAECQGRIDEAHAFMKTQLSGLRELTRQYGTEVEASAFFTDYTAFVTGTPQSLEAYYRDLGVA